MAISLVVAITDHDWFQTLRDLPDLGEVNFWSPGTQNFKALQPGELFLFKLKARHGGKIVGGGIFAHSTRMPLSMAWQSFGEANGAQSYEELRGLIAPLKGTRPYDLSDFEIGCRILTQPFFFDEPDWIEPPPDWAKNIVQFKTYNTAEPSGYRVWEQVQDKLRRQASRQMGRLVADSPAVYGSPQIVQPHLDEGAFRAIVTDVYERRCAVTRERTLPALAAAHIRPIREGGEHATTNGLLLRKDIHSLFDWGYVTVRPSLEFAVSARIKQEFGNGHEYYHYDGSKILVPQDPRHQPDPVALMWHNENVFMG